VMLGVERRRMDGSGRFSDGIVVSGPKMHRTRMAVA